MRSAGHLTRAARQSVELGRSRPAVVVTCPPAPRSHYSPALYSGLHGRGIAWTEVAPLELAGLAPTAATAGVDMVVHIQWTSWALGTTPSIERLDRARDAVDSVHPHPLIWTVHNVLPHDTAAASVESDLRTHLTARSSAIHVMNPNTARMTEPHYPLPSRKIVEIPHPDLWPYHGGIRTREAARRQLALPEDRTVVSAIGQIRPYKGIEHLLDVAGSLPNDVTLLLAGNPIGDYGAAIVQKATAQRGVEVLGRHLSDDDIGAAICASDVVAFPYTRMLNSGILDLAQRAGIRTVEGTSNLAERIVEALGQNRPAERTDVDAAERFADFVQSLLESRDGSSTS